MKFAQIARDEFALGGRAAAKTDIKKLADFFAERGRGGRVDGSPGGEKRSEFHEAEAGAIVERDLAVDDCGAGEEVVFDEQGAVEIGPIDQRRKLRRGGDGTGGFCHATKHDLEV